MLSMGSADEGQIFDSFFYNSLEILEGGMEVGLGMQPPPELQSSINYPLPPIEIRGNKLIAGGKEIKIRGINWFGFNNKQTMVDGLWAGKSAFATDFNIIVYKLKLLGFNAIRLPFTFNDLDLPAKDKTIPCTGVSKQEILKRTVDPLWKGEIKWTNAPGFKGDIGSRGICNGYLVKEGSSTLKRLDQVVLTFLENGFYVVLDYHPMDEEPYAYDTREMTRRWKNLWEHYVEMPQYDKLIKRRVILDLMNEPDSMRLGWQKATGGRGVGTIELFLKTMDELWKVTTDSIFMIEGNGQIGYNLNWGDGFVTDKKIVREFDIQDASGFFDGLLKRPYSNNVIISPHMYGPTISKNDRAHKGDILRKRMEKSFGYLYDPGYCNGKGKCIKFPVVVGEFGSTFKDPRDMEFLEDFAKWMGKKFGSGHWMYWSFNENSGDTGGIVKNGWQDFEWGKLRWLKERLGLKPWYA